jgi:hypothetical protein
MIPKIEIEKECLCARQKALNEEFVWTEEARAAILKLNQKIFACEKLLHEEFDARKKELEERVRGGDRFLTDYHIEMKIRLAILTWHEEDDEWYHPEEGVYCVLNDLIEESSRRIARANYHRLEDGAEILNGNARIGSASEHFKGEVIHYAFQYLCDEARFAWEDVLKINSLSAEVTVVYRRLTDYWFEAQERADQ